MNDNSKVTVRCWSALDQAPFGEEMFARDDGGMHTELANARVVLPQGGLDRAAELLAAGASQVLFGSAALKDSGIIRRAAQQFGQERVGVWLPVRRMPVSWSLDRESNADFSCIVPSCPVPRWEALMDDILPTGTDAIWFAGQMRQAGAASVVIAVDMTEDADLTLCAELVTALGDSAWLTYRQQANADYAAWVRYGQARHLIVPSSTEKEALLACFTEHEGPAA